ncbi:nucleotide sugar dehydrogenase [Rossellomorea aquimaris]|uniref:UDP-N-acetyl-D-glucosamine dehydrogenase n=1 Tax=Rossellomorea aquimaris TaxID=189382 RepID=A0A1J6W9Z3_9BACI|nr:nucleotide sugar dehydrogenase [Rossellomorea aquimaris]OIU68696.1 UDP-N-acetyl-D-glucosamine dehydrogenase [Rossellomorea aquimaris]
MGEMNKKAAIVGLGYVGIPLAELFLKGGWEVFGIDVDAGKIESLLKHRSYLSDYTDEEIKGLFSRGLFHPGTSYEVISKVDTVILCIPTPLTPDHKPDLTFLKKALAGCVPFLQKDQLMILESSTYPGTTEEVLCPEIGACGFTLGKDYYAAYSPERIDPGNKVYSLHQIPKVIGGMTEECTRRAAEAYGSIFDSIVPVSSPRAAEMCKLVENSQRLINISFMNELLLLSSKLDLDLWEVIDAAGTKPFGFTPYYPGPGIGGHCIPVDPMYLLWKAEQSELNLSLIKEAHRINEAMPHYVISKIEKLTGSGTIKGKCIFIIGAAYKKNVNDARESSALKIMDLLLKKGAKIQYHDPYIPELQVNGYTLETIDLTEDVLSRADLTLIHTNHSSLDYETIAQFSNCILDTRHVLELANPKVNYL